MSSPLSNFRMSKTAPVFVPAANAAATKTAEEDRKAFHCSPPKKLDEIQLKRLGAIIDPNTKYTLFSKNKVSRIEFSWPEVRDFLANELSGVLDIPYLTGGGASNVLTGLEHADADITYYISSSSSYGAIETAVTKFVAAKFKVSFDTAKEYLCERSSGKTSDPFLYLGLGNLELRFIVKDTDFRHHVATTDAFHIPLNGENSAYCFFGYDFDETLLDLQNRILKVKKPKEVEDLFLRLVHKMTQGFEILSEKENDLFEIALAKMQNKYLHGSAYELSPLRVRLLKHWNHHYSEKNQTGRLIDCLNLLTVIQKIQDRNVRLAYVKCIAETCGASQMPSLQTLAKLLNENVASDNFMQDILAFARGLVFIQWSNSDNITGYKFPFFKSEQGPRGLLSIRHNQGTQYLSVAHAPDKTLEEYLASWKRLEQGYTKNLAEMQQFAKDIGCTTFVPAPANHGVAVKSLIDGFAKFSADYGASLSPTSFCKTVMLENEGLLKKDAGIPQTYMHQRNIEYHLNYWLKQPARQTTDPTYGFVAMLLGCIRQTQKITPNDILQHLSNTKFISCITADKLLKGLIPRTLAMLLNNFPINESKTAVAFQKVVLALYKLNLLKEDEIASVATAFLNGANRVLASMDAEELLATEVFMTTVRDWGNPLLDRSLNELSQNLSRAMLPAAKMLAGQEKTQRAFDCFFAALQISEKNDFSKEFHAVFDLLLSQSANLNKYFSIVANAAEKVFSGRPVKIQAQQSEKLLTIAKQLLAAPKKSSSACAEQSWKLLTLLSHQSEQPDIILNSMLKAMAGMLVSQGSDDVNTLSHKFVELLKIWEQRLTTDQRSELNNLPQLLRNNFQDGLRSFILIAAEFNLSIANDIISRDAFAKLLKETAKVELTWKLIDKLSTNNRSQTANLADSATCSDFLERAFALWKLEATKGLSPEQAFISLQLVNRLYEISPKEAPERAVEIIAKVQKTLKNDCSTTSLNNHQELIFATINKLIDSSTSESLRLAQNLAEAAAEGHWIASDHLPGIYNRLMQGYICKLGILPPKDTSSAFFDMGIKAIDGHLIVDQIIQQCTEGNGSFFRLGWETLHKLMEAVQWNSDLEIKLGKLLSVYKASSSFAEEYVNASLSFLKSVVQNNTVTSISLTTNSRLFEFLIQIDEIDLCQNAWMALSSAKSQQQYLICNTILSAICQQSLPKHLKLIKACFLQNEFLGSPQFLDVERNKSFKLIFHYISSLKLKGKELRQYADLLSELLDQSSRFQTDPANTEAILKHLHLLHMKIRDPDSLVRDTIMLLKYSTSPQMVLELFEVITEYVSNEQPTIKIVESIYSLIQHLFLIVEDPKIHAKTLNLLTSLLSHPNDSITEAIFDGLRKFLSRGMQITTNSVTGVSISSKVPFDECCRLMCKLHQILYVKQERHRPNQSMDIDELWISQLSPEQNKAYSAQITATCLQPFYEYVLKLQTDDLEVLLELCYKTPHILRLSSSHHTYLRRKIYTKFLEIAAFSFKNVNLLAPFVYDIHRIAQEADYFQIESSSAGMKEAEDIFKDRTMSTIHYLLTFRNHRIGTGFEKVCELQSMSLFLYIDEIISKTMQPNANNSNLKLNMQMAWIMKFLRILIENKGDSEFTHIVDESFQKTLQSTAEREKYKKLITQTLLTPYLQQFAKAPPYTSEEIHKRICQAFHILWLCIQNDQKEMARQLLSTILEHSSKIPGTELCFLNGLYKVADTDGKIYELPSERADAMYESICAQHLKVGTTLIQSNILTEANGYDNISTLNRDALNKCISLISYLDWSKSNQQMKSLFEHINKLHDRIYLTSIFYGKKEVYDEFTNLINQIFLILEGQFNQDVPEFPSEIIIFLSHFLQKGVYMEQLIGSFLEMINGNNNSASKPAQSFQKHFEETVQKKTPKEFADDEGSLGYMLNNAHLTPCFHSVGSFRSTPKRWVPIRTFISDIHDLIISKMEALMKKQREAINKSNWESPSAKLLTQAMLKIYPMIGYIPGVVEEDLSKKFHFFTRLEKLAFDYAPTYYKKVTPVGVFHPFAKEIDSKKGIIGASQLKVTSGTLDLSTAAQIAFAASCSINQLSDIVADAIAAPSNSAASNNTAAANN